MKIMVVDDSQTSLMLITTYLEKLDHDVVAFVDPVQAIKNYKSVKPELVILDVMMDVIDGYECARRIRQFQHSIDDWIPIIFVSALVDDASISLGINAGGDEYITKPFSETLLLSKIKSMQRIAQMRSRLTLLSDKLKQLNNRLTLMSLTDDLTGVFNRRAFDSRYSKEFNRASRLSGDASVLAVLMIDVDEFKKYNDEYGHQKGDDCLKQISEALDKTLCREYDELFRYGGEEFVVLLPGAKEAGAMSVAERLINEIADLAIKHASVAKRKVVTVSIGAVTAEVTRQFSKEDLLLAADKALYSAKASGRNTCVFKQVG